MPGHICGLLAGVHNDVGSGSVPGNVITGVALSLQKCGVQRLEGCRPIEVGLLPLTVLLYGRVAAGDRGLEVTQSFVTLRQQEMGLKRTGNSLQ